MKDYRNERVVIVGLGITGLSCIDFFLTRGVKPRVMDTRLTPPGLAKLPTDISCHLGSLNEAWLLNATLIVVSPGISLLHPVLVAAAAAGITIIGDIELFAHEASAPIVAITGSNGKSTVAHMVGQMAASAGWLVGVGANIGLPALMLLKIPYQLYILELSSFQLESTYSLQPAVATVLNISEDHMNRYPLGLQQYRSVKLKIFHGAAICVINIDDKLTIPIQQHNSYYISFGIDSGDYHLGHSAGKTWLMMHDKPLLNCSEMAVCGCHYYANALAALAIADAIGIPRIASLAALRSFRSLPHRFELVHDRNGVRWINDSKATNVSSTKTALSGLMIKGTLHLLLGGDGKSADFTPLASLVQDEQIQLYCFGKDSARLASMRLDAVTLTKTLEQAMQIIGTRVKTGDLVLLSPACASLDQFSNFEVRGKVFTSLAREVG